MGDADIFFGEENSGIVAAGGVDSVVDRVDGVAQFGNVFADILSAHSVVVEAIEIGVKWDENLFVEECLATIWNVLSSTALVLEVLELFACV